MLISSNGILSQGGRHKQGTFGPNTAPLEGSTERGFEHGGLQGPWRDLGVGARDGVCCEGISANKTAGGERRGGSTGMEIFFRFC